MDTSIAFTFFSILSLLLYVIPFVFILFIVWFALKFLKIQEQKNEILQ